MNLLDVTKPQAARNAWIVWMIFFVVIAAIAGSPSNRRSVTNVYREASLNWFEGSDIYQQGIYGYLYLPQSCILTAPFAIMPFRVAEISWRAFAVGILAIAVWRLSRLGRQGGGTQAFPLMTLLVIPTAMESARNGQMNIPMAALMTLAAVELAGRRWSPAAFWLLLGVALKPLVIAMLGFAAVLYRPLRWRLGPGLVIVFALPFLTQSPGYVFAQYRLFFTKMLVAGNPHFEQFSDFFGIARSIGFDVPSLVQNFIRVAAAVAIIVLSYIGLSRWGHERGTLLFFSFAACFTLLFSPRTENNTYVLAGVPMALFCSWALLYDRRRLTGAIMAAAIIIMAASYEITRGNNCWLSPSVCLGFVLYLIYLLLGQRPATESGD